MDYRIYFDDDEQVPAPDPDPTIEPIENYSDYYDFVVNFIDIFKKIVSEIQLKYPDFKYVLSNNFINKTLFCHEFYKTINDFLLDIYINTINEDIFTIIYKYINNINNNIFDSSIILLYKDFQIVRIVHENVENQIVNINNTYIMLPRDNSYCNDTYHSINDFIDDSQILELYNEYSIKHFETTLKLKYPIVYNTIFDRNIEHIENIQYLWDYTRHSKTLNMNLLKIANGELGYDYPIVKESSQENAKNIIYQYPGFLQEYIKVTGGAEYLFNGDIISVIKEKLIKVMKDIIDNTLYNYDNGFFCFRMTKYVDPNKINNIFELRAKVGESIYIPTFYSCFRNIEDISLDWLLSFRNILLIIYVDANIKNFVSIDPCIKTSECFFGSENELLFMPGFSLKIIKYEKVMINYNYSNFFIDALICRIEYIPELYRVEPYEKKYLKYKQKYLKLKKTL
jgi:hypothetical protein